MVAERLARLRHTHPNGSPRMPPVSQVALADLLGIRRTTVANVEKRRQRVPTWYLYAVCEVLGEDVHQVLPSIDEVVMERRRLAAAGEKRAVEIGGERFELERELLEQIEGVVAGDGLEDRDA